MVKAEVQTLGLGFRN